MTQAQATWIADDDILSPVRALHSLTPAHVDQIVAGLSSLAPAWSIERHESCDGHLSLLVGHAACDASILIDRDHAGINVSLMLDDKLHTSRHRFAIIGDAIKAMAATPTIEPQRHVS